MLQYRAKLIDEALADLIKANHIELQNFIEKETTIHQERKKTIQKNLSINNKSLVKSTSDFFITQDKSTAKKQFQLISDSNHKDISKGSNHFI